MKKTLTLLWMASALWAAASCSKSEMDIQEADIPEAVIPSSAESAESVKVNISVSGLSPETKAIKTGWTSGDIINVYLDDAESIHTPDFTLTYDGSSWNASALDAAVVARLKARGGTLFGFWEDSNSCINNDKWEKGVWYNRSSIRFPNSTQNYEKEWEVHLVADFSSISYTFSESDRTLSAKINKWEFYYPTQVVVSGLTYTPGRYVILPNSTFLEAGDSIYMSREHDSPKIKGGLIYERLAGIENEDGVAFVGYTERRKDKREYKISLLDKYTNTIYYFKKKISLPSLVDESKVTAIKIPFSKFYVDLGLSVKWGACNLGATDPIDGGDYYAWAELEPYYTPGHAGDYTCSSWKTGKTGYNWESYKYHAHQGPPYIWKHVTKYTVDDGQHGGIWYSYRNNAWEFEGDGLDTLEPGDDAARQLNGEGWRMPTAAEWQELMDNCTWTWNEDYYNNGIVVQSEFLGYGLQKIFLPVVGWREDNKLNEKYGWGAYWSSTINSHDSSQGQSAFFTADKKNLYPFYRSHGLSVRPVRVD